MASVGMLILALAWVALLAPWIARTACARLRASLSRDIEAAKSATVDVLMPSVLSDAARRKTRVFLSAIFLVGSGVVGLSVGVSSLQAWAYVALFSSLFVLSLIDLDTQLLPGVGGVLWSGLLAATLHVVPMALEEAILGAVVGWILLSLPNGLLSLTRPESQPAVGAGDVSLVAACGAWLGPQHIIVAGCLATLAAMAIRCVSRFRARSVASSSADDLDTIKGAPYLPFGPLIGVSVIVVLSLKLHFAA
ncbi:hypothetical protein A3839_28055 [Achromobacter insolitus]|nr:hypothetical protein A3839_28055 [Achromobacter insolitus]